MEEETHGLGVEGDVGAVNGHRLSEPGYGGKNAPGSIRAVAVVTERPDYPYSKDLGLRIRTARFSRWTWSPQTEPDRRR